MVLTLALALLASTGAPQPSGTGSDNRIARAATTATCPRDSASPFAQALERLPGQADASLDVIATLSGPADAGGLGSLCAAIVRDQGDRFTRVATLSPTDRPSPPSDVEPVTDVDVSIDSTPFRFRPGETAFAVRATGEYNSTAINVGWSTLYLFRRNRSVLVPIFVTRIEEQTIDKTGTDPDVHRRWAVRFDTRQHRGAYDLLLGETGHHMLHRFVWNGDRYIAFFDRTR